MIRLLAIVLLCAAPLCAEAESNFGRVILAKCDIIVQGVAAAKRTMVKDLFRVELSIERVLHGKCEAVQVNIYFHDRTALKEDEAVRGLFALKAIATGGWSLVSKPVLTPVGDKEEKAKVEVLQAFLNLEAEPPGEERTELFWDLLESHVRRGGYDAQNAAIELIFVARDRQQIVTLERFNNLRAAVKAADALLSKLARHDLQLALQGMVENRIKSLAYRRVRRGEKPADRQGGIDELRELLKDFPRAFHDDDRRLCLAISEAEKDRATRAALVELADAIRNEVARREAEPQPAR